MTKITNIKINIAVLGIGILVIGAYLGFGTWNLGFSYKFWHYLIGADKFFY